MVDAREEQSLWIDAHAVSIIVSAFFPVWRARYPPEALPCEEMVKILYLVIELH